jgi:hypothetical protein
MREWFFDLWVWNRTTAGWRLSISGYTAEAGDGPTEYVMPIVDWVTSVASFPPAACSGMREGAEYPCPPVGDFVELPSSDLSRSRPGMAWRHRCNKAAADSAGGRHPRRTGPVWPRPAGAATLPLFEEQESVDPDHRVGIRPRRPAKPSADKRASCETQMINELGLSPSNGSSRSRRRTMSVPPAPRFNARFLFPGAPHRPAGPKTSLQPDVMSVALGVAASIDRLIRPDPTAWRTPAPVRDRMTVAGGLVARGAIQ